jgi:hypothetical protein
MRYMLASYVHQAAGLLLLSFWLSSAGPTVERDPARDLLQNMQAAQSRLKNYQCSVEYVDSADYAARKRLLENALKTPDMPEHLVRYYERDLEGTGRHYEFQKVVGDGAGRIKIAHTVGRYGTDGKQEPTQENTSAWDGDTSITYLPPGDGSPFGGAQITAGRNLCFQAMRHPLWSFGGRFYAALDRAIDGGEKIEIQREPTGGLLRIHFAGGEAIAPTPKWVWAAVVDPARGFCVPEWEFTRPDGAKSRFSATFREVQPSVWFPTAGRVDGFFPDGMVESRTSVKITDVVVNDPNFSNNLFHIDLPPGTRVRDMVKGLKYVVGNPDSTCTLPTPRVSPDDHDAARELLQSMQSAQSRLKNYQCVAEYATFHDYESRKRLYEIGAAEGDPPDVLKRLADNIKSSGKTYELQTVVADSNGRIKIASQHAEYDLNNKKQPTIQMASAWDGKTSIMYTRPHPDGPGGAALGAERDDSFRMMRHPLWSFGGAFLEAFEKAVQAGKKIEIREETPGGLREIRFMGDDPVVARGADFPWTATVDPAKSFSVVKWGFTWPDGQDAWFYATLKEFKDGIWLPVEGKIEGHFADGVVDAVTTVKITNVVVNDPNFSNDLFHIGLPPGTHVRDTVTGLQYFVGDSSEPGPPVLIDRFR